MDDQAPFLAAIAASPADDAPRLVFADWLDEHGQPERAEFIRVQVAHARQPTLRTRRRELALLRAHHDLFAGPLAAEGVRYEFQRGFIVGFGHVGVYVFQALVTINTLLRFYPNGDVIAAVRRSTSLTEAACWFHREQEHAYHGRYTLEAFANPPTLAFAARLSKVTLEFAGVFDPRRLDLEFLSHPNDHRSQREFVLTPLGDMTTLDERIWSRGKRKK